MYQPLADELRPKTLDAAYGQEHILGPGKMLRRIIESVGRIIPCDAGLSILQEKNRLTNTPWGYIIKIPHGGI